MNSAKQKTVVIVGGGFSGLIQAFYLVEKNISVRVLEKEDRLGGLIGSKRQGDGLIEQAANAFLANRELERVADQIGVKLVARLPASNKRFIFRDGSMTRWPLSVKESLPLMPLVIKKIFGKKIEQIDGSQSLRNWGNLQIGEPATDYLLEPAMQGVYAVSAEKLSAAMVLSSVGFKAPRGRMKGSVAPEGGMQEWVDKMKAYLSARGCQFQMTTADEEFKNHNNLIFAVGLGHLKNLVNNQKLELPQSILDTRMASLTSVTLTYEKPKSTEGFGCLFPRKEDFNCLGVLFNHNIFPGRTQAGGSETWILNDQKMEFSSMSHEAIIRYILSDRFKLFGQFEEATAYDVNQWPGRIPVYDENLEKFIRDVDELKPSCLLVGNYLGQLGLSKILFRAKENAAKVVGGYFG